MSDAVPDQCDEALSHVVDLPHSPAKVWRALTEPALVARWLAESDALSGASTEAGARFTLKAPLDGAGDVACEILDAEPPHLLRWRWRSRRDDETLDTVVSFALTPLADGGARLTINHQGFAANAAKTETPAVVAQLAPLRRLPASRRILRAALSPAARPRMRLAA